eukprot:scaffold14281_cov102-Isochrysis_galbana.AAC.1
MRQRPIGVPARCFGPQLHTPMPDARWPLSRKRGPDRKKTKPEAARRQGPDLEDEPGMMHRAACWRVSAADRRGPTGAPARSGSGGGGQPRTRDAGCERGSADQRRRVDEGRADQARLQLVGAAGQLGEH